MGSLLLLVVCLLAGVLLQRVAAVPANAAQALDQFVIHISLPALGLYFIPELTFSAELIFPVATGWIVFLGSAGFFLLLQRLFGWSRKLTGCLIVVAGLGNTSFIGFPVIEALYGKPGLTTAVLVDQSTFIVLATLGVGVSAWYARGGTTMGELLLKIVRFPPFIAFVVALLLNLLGMRFHADIKDMLWRIGATVSPVALVSVGLQLKIERRSKHWGMLSLGLLYKLVLAPMIVFGLYALLAGRRDPTIAVCVLEAAMAPMITGAIVASSYGLKPKLANMLIGIGIPLSFLTLLGWWWVVRGW